MSATTTVIIPTKSLVKLSKAAREAVSDTANVLSGASAGAGQGRGAGVASNATVATDTGVTNDGGTSMPGGVVWVKSLSGSAADVVIQLGPTTSTVSLPSPALSYGSVDAYVAEIIANIDARQNLDVGFGTTDLVYTQVAAGTQFSSTTWVEDLVAGDIVTVCGVQFTNATGADADAPNAFDSGASPGDPNRLENKVGNHPALCGKVVAVVSSDSFWVGSILPVPSLQFTFSLQSSAVNIQYISPSWVDGSTGAVDAQFGSPLVLFFEDNAEDVSTGFGFGFTGTDIADVVLPDFGSVSPSGFNGADAPPTVESTTGNINPDVAAAHDIRVVLTQKAVTSHYPQQAPMSALVSQNGRTTAQKLVRLLNACLSGTDGAGDIATIQVQTRNAGTPVQDLTWTVGSH